MFTKRLIAILFIVVFSLSKGHALIPHQHFSHSHTDNGEATHHHSSSVHNARHHEHEAHHHHHHNEPQDQFLFEFFGPLGEHEDQDLIVIDAIWKIKNNEKFWVQHQDILCVDQNLYFLFLNSYHKGIPNVETPLIKKQFSFCQTNRGPPAC